MNLASSDYFANLFGVTLPLSLDEPTAEDHQQTEELRAALEPQKIFEMLNGLNKGNNRKEVLAKLNILVRQWLIDPSLTKSMTVTTADKLGGEIYNSLNDCHVKEAISKLVPHPENYHLTLRVITLWAHKHGIYSESLGYFGSITWAILVARICQLFPNAIAATLVQKFFFVFSHWNWPIPILLKHSERVVPLAPNHLMPVITPAYPQQNSTFKVTESTKKVIIKEFERGRHLTDEIMSDDVPWDRLFEAPSFFYSYRHFIVLLVHSKTAEDHLEWCGLVESKIRLFVDDLERNRHISLVHINPKCFDHKLDSNCSMWFIGLEFECADQLNLDLTKSMELFTEHLLQQALKAKVLKKGMTIEARHVNRLQLAQYLHADLLKSERKAKKRFECVSNTSIALKRQRSASDFDFVQNDEPTEKERCKVRRLSNGSENSYSTSDGEVITITPSHCVSANGRHIVHIGQRRNGQMVTAIDDDSDLYLSATHADDSSMDDLMGEMIELLCV